MGQIIMGLIALALFAAIGLAGVFLGGDVFSGGNAKAQATATKTQMEQVAGAAQIYRVNTGSNPADGAVNSSHALVTASYLKSAPSLDGNIATTQTVSIAGTTVTAAITAEEVCTKIGAGLLDPNLTCVWTTAGAVVYDY